MFTCSCGYVYTRSFHPDTGKVGAPRFQAFDPSLAPVLREMVRAGYALREIARRLEIDPKTVIKLASHPNIQAIKEATGELNRIRVLRDACGPGFKLLSGDDATCCEFMLQGGDGVISVTANVAAAGMRQLCDAAIAGQRAAAGT